MLLGLGSCLALSVLDAWPVNERQRAWLNVVRGGSRGQYPFQPSPLIQEIDAQEA